MGKFPGGAYHVPTTIFEELEEEGINVPEEFRYFPYHATFNFECYFGKENANQEKNTDKLTWQSSRVRLSFNVCSNMLGYQELKCFVSEGNSEEPMRKFVECMVAISTKSSSLLRQQYAPVFEALVQASVPRRGETHEDQLLQMLVDMQEGNEESSKDENSEEESEDESRDIDLMASDDEEDEEEIEPENEEDRVFLDDEVSENDPSFYRRLNVELDEGRRQEMPDCEDMLIGEQHTSNNKVLCQLEEKLNGYIQELPVLGFNSGKYDLNAVKEFLFPYLIETQPVKFTVKKKRQPHVPQD